MSPAEPVDDALDAPREGSTRDLVCLFSPESQRDAVRALLNIETEISRSRRAGVDHSVSHARLDWWQHEAQRLLTHRPSHPLTRRVAQAFVRLESSPPDLSTLVESAGLDLACAAFDSRAVLDDYFRLWADGLFRSVVLLGSRGLASRSALEGFASQAGAALREIELLAMLASDAREGRFHVPIGEDETEHERWRLQPWDDECARLVSGRLEDCALRLRVAAQALPSGTISGQRTALVWCALGLRASRIALRALPEQPRMGRWDSAQATWVAWRSAIAADRGKLPFLLRTRP
jgi:phytoene/squalene synthetase